MSKIRIFLADDHTMLREGLVALITSQSDMQVVGQADSGRTLFQSIQSCQADIVIMDISMPDVSGIQATSQLQELCPEIKVIALTRHSEPGYVRQMLQAGARGYVLKQAAADELLLAIRSVAQGQSFLDSTLSNRVVDGFFANQGQPSPASDLALSEREAEVVRLTAYGYSNKEIALQLGISAKTVDTYKVRAMEKLGLHSRVGLVQYALQKGWLEQT